MVLIYRDKQCPPLAEAATSVESWCPHGAMRVISSLTMRESAHPLREVLHSSAERVQAMKTISGLAATEGSAPSA